MKHISRFCRAYASRYGAILVAVLVAALAVVAVAVSAETGGGEDRRGHVAGNDTVGVDDARLVLQHIVGKRILTPEEYELADVNCDGEVNIGDARLILQFIVGKINAFPPRPTASTGSTTPSESAATTQTTGPTGPTEPPKPLPPPKENTIQIGNYYDGDYNKYQGTAFVYESGDNGDWLNSGMFGKFLLRKEENPNLPYSVACYNSSTRNEVSALLPAGIDITGLVPVFTVRNGSYVVTSDGDPVVSGVTVLNFYEPLTLVIHNNDRVRELVITVETLETGLPSLSIITGDMSTIDSKDYYKPVGFYVGGGDSGLCDYAQAAPLYTAGGAKGRGNTSWNFPKKQFNIKLTNKTSVLGMPRARDWSLINNYEDRSMLRNQMGQYLAEQAGMQYILKQVQVDFWYNGRYMGTYVLSEKKEVDENRVNIPQYYPGAKPGEIGYFLEFDGHCPERVGYMGNNNWAGCERPLGGQRISPDDYDWMAENDPGNPQLAYRWMPYYHPASDNTFFRIPIGGKWVKIKNPKYPDEILNDKGHLTYIQAKVMEAVTALQQRNWDEIDRLMDVRSFVKWYIVEDYMNNTDSSFHGSCFMTLEPGGKFKMGPVWDFDRSSGSCAYWNWPEESFTNHQGLYNSGAAWFFLLFEHPEARAILKEEWRTFYNNIQNIRQVLEYKTEIISRSQVYNYQIWDTLGRYVVSDWAETPDMIKADTFEKQVVFLRNWLLTRRTKMDNFIRSLPDEGMDRLP
ncbi:MAG: CotH kinase family protein [Oscillospiraceae bacterium]|nr:CotH kinase family protein [Oscillospiraceae bacterium]